jgi:hypothetical protein
VGCAAALPCGCPTAGRCLLRVRPLRRARVCTRQLVLLSPVAALLTCRPCRPAPRPAEACETELEEVRHRFASQAEELQRVRKKCLPG